MRGCKTTPPSRRTTWHRAGRSCRKLPHGQQMRAKGKQQQLGYWSRAGPYAPALPCSSSKVDSLPQCSGDQRVKKMGFIRQGLGEACDISTNSIRVSISLSHTSPGLWVLESLPCPASPSTACPQLFPQK